MTNIEKSNTKRFMIFALGCIILGALIPLVHWVVIVLAFYVSVYLLFFGPKSESQEDWLEEVKRWRITAVDPAKPLTTGNLITDLEFEQILEAGLRDNFEPYLAKKVELEGRPRVLPNTIVDQYGSIHNLYADKVRAGFLDGYQRQVSESMGRRPTAVWDSPHDPTHCSCLKCYEQRVCEGREEILASFSWR